MSGSHLCIPRNKTVISATELLCSGFRLLLSHICERFIFSRERSAYSAAGKYVDRSWEYINCSQTHECGKIGIEAAQFPEKEYITGIFLVVQELFSRFANIGGYGYFEPPDVKI